MLRFELVLLCHCLCKAVALPHKYVLAHAQLKEVIPSQGEKWRSQMQTLTNNKEFNTKGGKEAWSAQLRRVGIAGRYSVACRQAGGLLGRRVESEVDEK